MIIFYCFLGFILANLISWRLVPAIFIRKSKLPSILQDSHSDWWFFLRWIPRRITALVGGRNPVQLLGSNPKEHNQDIPAAGTWCLSWPFHLAILTRKGKLFAFGIRRDYVDQYWTFRFVWRKK
jgi:hypothetical protein